MDSFIRGLIGISLLALLLPVQVQAQSPTWEELRNRFTHLFHQGRYALASQVATDAVALARETFGSDAPQVAEALDAFASSIIQKGQYAEAAELYRTAIAIQEKNFGIADTARLRYVKRLADIFYMRGSTQEARPLYLEAIDGLSRLRGRDHVETALAIRSLGEVAYEESNYDEAASLMQQSLTSLATACGPNDQLYRTTSLRLAAIYTAARNTEAARGAYHSLIDAIEPVFGQMSDALVPPLTGLARLEGDARNLETAEALYERIIAIDRSNQGEMAAVVATDIAQLVDLHLRSGKPERARYLAEDGVRIWEHLPEAPQISVARAYRTLAAVYDGMNLDAEAQSAYERAVDVAGNAKEVTYTIQYLSDLAGHFERRGELSSARSTLERALEIVRRRGATGIETAPLTERYSAILAALNDTQSN